MCSNCCLLSVPDKLKKKLRFFNFKVQKTLLKDASPFLYFVELTTAVKGIYVKMAGIMWDRLNLTGLITLSKNSCQRF